MVGTLWPIMAENLLGFSTHSSQDITFFAPLLLPAEAALLVLGAGLLIWKWKEPGAFLMLLSGLGALFVGGTLVMETNSAPPQTIYWTAAFPAIYAAIAIPIGAWAEFAAGGAARSGYGGRCPRRWGRGWLCWVRSMSTFTSTITIPTRTSSRTRATGGPQTYYEIQTAQSRYIASLGTGYRVAIVGPSQQPYDAATTYYLLGTSADVVKVVDPRTELATVPVAGKRLAFIFFPGN